MGKHIQPEEHTLKAPPHSGSSKPAARKNGTRTAAVPEPAPRARGTNSKTVTSGPARNEEITEEQIAVRAYEIWHERGCPAGCDGENWFEARRQLHEQLSSPQSATASVLSAEVRRKK
jgi:hypothetical protein